MKICKFLVLSFIFSIHNSYSQDSVSVKNFIIDNDTLAFHLTIYYPHSSGVSFVNLHDDENTSVEAGLNFISQYGGALLQLQHTGKRRFSFTMDGQAFSFDPNRIFTNTGIKETLARQGIYWEDAASEIRRLADSFLLNYVDNKKLVVAMHNNTERGLSILNYKKGGNEYQNTGKLYISRNMNPHDFILTTESSIYHHLKRKKINVVLQHHNPKDDGSLSVYAAKKRIHYINVEAQHDNLEEQIRMLEALKDIIFRY